jgi:hypothetical protein
MYILEIQRREDNQEKVKSNCINILIVSVSLKINYPNF